MKKLLPVLCLLSSASSYGQRFNFSYSNYGLGSNRGMESYLLVNITDTVLTYSTAGEDPKDTVGILIIPNPGNKRKADKIPFRASSLDSILHLLKGKEGKYIFASNPMVMSGSVHQLYFEYKDWCTEFSLKNTFDSTAMHIVHIINSYLPKSNPIYIPYDCWTERDKSPLVKECTGGKAKKYSDLLGDEYDQLQQNKK